mmetsp:Transcript_90010/g.199989  ORF Transcript_90010/g.199989 Transcript_90010/m.199989 type:complete len:291 (+) Transcript_90010:907-1779(+)
MPKKAAGFLAKKAAAPSCCCSCARLGLASSSASCNKALLALALPSAFTSKGFQGIAGLSGLRNASLITETAGSELDNARPSWPASCSCSCTRLVPASPSATCSEAWPALALASALASRANKGVAALANTGDTRPITGAAGSMLGSAGISLPASCTRLEPALSSAALTSVFVPTSNEGISGLANTDDVWLVTEAAGSELGSAGASLLGDCLFRGATMDSAIAFTMPTGDGLGGGVATVNGRRISRFGVNGTASSCTTNAGCNVAEVSAQVSVMVGRVSKRCPCSPPSSRST